MKKNLFLFLICLFAASCVRFPLIVPEVTVAHLTITEVKLLETSFVFTIRLDNENPLPLFYEGGVYHFYLDGARVGKGLSDSQFEIPRLGTATDEVVVRTSNVNLGFKIKNMIDAKTLDYRLDGRVYINLEGRIYEVHVVKDGVYFFDEARDAE